MTQRENALQSIAQDMRETPDGDDAQINKSESSQRGNRALSAVSWYPRTRALKNELRMMAWNEETSMAALLQEGLSEVFRRRGKKIEDYL